eukprot:TRINITY_DN47730_c0_g1_i1.p1 TRINITY_DN47730_c0_g1~~TRINITY_DN47730_c0_g1_i1.p1  ORF type:complete len:925 (+),score=186.67 TRINITY_DN47730_c0_g1_i1:37-2775(+)
MGCSSSSAADATATPARRPSRDEDDSEIKRQVSSATAASKASVRSNASECSQEQHRIAHERLRMLQDLDEKTKIPFILVELRGCAGGESHVEICGKDEYGVYEALDQFLTSEWGCHKLDAGDLSEDTPLPFCDAFYSWPFFKAAGEEGLSNMGLATMRLVDFMCGHLSWTLGVINGGNVGEKGEVREQQVIFKAPHPMNLVSSHVMVELRSAGYVELCSSDEGALRILKDHFQETFGCAEESGHADFCDMCLRTDSMFKERGRSGENNVGRLTSQVCDAVVRLLPGFSLVTVNGGNYGEDGSHREQQMVFRWDNHPLREASHILVELREAGFIEICGEDVDGVHGKLVDWLKKKWGCKDPMKIPGQEPFCDVKLTWSSSDMLWSSAELTGFFHGLGWQMQVCSQGTVVTKKGKSECREQQIIFRPGSSKAGVVEPHLFLELYTGEGKDELYAKPSVTQVLGNQHIRFVEVGDCSSVTGPLKDFLMEYLGGELNGQDDNGVISLLVDVFMTRGQTDNNLGSWTMRVCDFMVDRLGWSFVVCNVCNLGPAGHYREQQLVFRYDGERRDVPVVRPSNDVLNDAAFHGIKLPSYWKDQEVLRHRKNRAILPCEQDEVEALQQIFDHTFKRILTRDRVYEYQAQTSEEMPYRLEVIHAFRSENAELYLKFAERRESYKGGWPLKAKTTAVGDTLNNRLLEGESYLAHGTNPSSAMAILKNGFQLDHAGKATGTMFGYGIYLAECVSKSDEYARDDNGGTYPGLMAMLMCRCLVGNPYIVQDAGDAVTTAREQQMDSVIGDRETKVGTYREFVFFDERQVLPEFAVIFRRQYEAKKVPRYMRSGTFGTTGRNWQVQLDKGWANIPPDVSTALNTAVDEGRTEIDCKIADFLYRFDLVKKIQINTATGTSRRIRPPMRR